MIDNGDRQAGKVFLALTFALGSLVFLDNNFFDFRFSRDSSRKSDLGEYSVLRVPLIRDRIPSVAQSVPLTY